MYFATPEYSVRERNERFLLCETSSGRSWFIPALALFLFVYQEPVIAYPGVFICLIIFTFSRVWRLDQSTGVVLTQIRILGMTIKEVGVRMDEVQRLKIARHTWGQGFHYRLFLIAHSLDRPLFVALHWRCSDLKRICSDFTQLLPKGITIEFHDDCESDQKFFGFR